MHGKLGLRPRNSFSGNTEIQISLQCVHAKVIAYIYPGPYYRIWTCDGAQSRDARYRTCLQNMDTITVETVVPESTLEVFSQYLFLLWSGILLSRFSNAHRKGCNCHLHCIHVYWRLSVQIKYKSTVLVHGILIQYWALMKQDNYTAFGNSKIFPLFFLFSFQKHTCREFQIK
jgi:hypothetical protein